MPTTSHHIFVLDDDPHFIEILKMYFKKLDLHATYFKTSSELKEALSKKAPSLLLVDLNLDEEGEGFELIQFIRSTYGESLPILILSAKTDAASVAHGIEIGANDYILKPIEYNVFSYKISPYVKGALLDQYRPKFKKVPLAAEKIELSIDFEVNSIDEFGISLLSKHLPSKGSTLLLEGPVVQEMTCSDSPLLVSILKTEFDSEKHEFLSYAEYESDNEGVFQNIRTWLLNRTV